MGMELMSKDNTTSITHVHHFFFREQMNFILHANKIFPLSNSWSYFYYFSFDFKPYDYD